MGPVLIEAEGRKAIVLPGDQRDEAFCKKLVADAVKQLDGLNLLVSNAGRQQVLPMSDRDNEAHGPCQ